MPNTFSGLARDVFTNEFSSNTGITTFSQISGWFAANVGSLNNLLNTSFSGVDPEIDEEAGNVYKLIYMASYYDRCMRSALMGITSSNSDGSNILSVSDGDNKISFVNKNEVSKVYKGVATDYRNEAKEMAYKYCMFLSQPISINSIDSNESTSGCYYWQ